MRDLSKAIQMQECHEAGLTAVYQELLAHGEFGSSDASSREGARLAAPAVIEAYLKATGFLLCAWQTIDSAPKNEDVILGVSDSDGWEHATQGRWVAGEEDQIDQPGHDAGFVDCDYTCFFPGRSFGPEKHQYEGTQPTHWMPLPAPPTNGTK